MLADAVLQAGWAGDYAMVTGGDSIFYFDRHEYARQPGHRGFAARRQRFLRAAEPQRRVRPNRVRRRTLAQSVCRHDARQG